MEGLRRLKQLHDALSALPFNEGTDSLFTAPDLHRDGGGLSFGPAVNEVPADPAGAEALRARCLAHPLIKGDLLTTNAQATLLVLHLAPERLRQTSPGAIAGQIEAVVGAHRTSFATIYQVGTPALQEYLVRTMKSDQRVMMPVCMALVMTLLMISTRSVLGGILPVVSTAVATVWMLGLMALTGVPVNLLNHIIPVLLLVMGSSEDGHLFHSFQSRYRATRDVTAALHATAQTVGLGLVLSVSTTLLGFASIVLSELPIMRDFALAAVIGLACRFLASCTLLPVCLRFWPMRLPPAQESAGAHGFSGRISAWTVRVLVSRSALLWIGMGVVGGAAVLASGWIRTKNDLLAFLPANAPVVARTRHVGETMGGFHSVYLCFKSQKGEFATPHGLEQLRDISQYLENLAGVGSARSFADIVARLHQQLRGGAPAEFRIPSDRAAISQMLLFVEPGLFKAFVTPDFAQANVVLRCRMGDGVELEKLLTTIRGELSSGRWGPLDFRLTGDSVLVAGAVSAVTRAQVFSLGSSLLLIFVIVWLLFLSARCGVITVAINLFSSVLAFGLMGAGGVPLDIGTCMVAAITLGLAMNDTLHLLVHFNHELRRSHDERVAMTAALQASWMPIVATSVALSAGFAALGFSSFAPVKEFGLLSAAVILVALAVDLFVTPAVVSGSRIVTLWDVLSPRLRQSQMLESSPFFRGLNKWQARRIVLASDISEYAAGQVVFRAGEEGRTMCLILTGCVEVFAEEGGVRNVISRLRGGEICGEVAFLSGVPRTFHVTAIEPSQLLILSQSSLASLQRFSPYLTSALLLNISRILCGRFVHMIHREASARAEG